MSRMRFILDMKLNLFCHFMICTGIHRYLTNQYYKQKNYALYDEETYRFIGDELPVYCLELLLKVVSDHPNFDADRLKQSLDSYLFTFLNEKTKKYSEYWVKRESELVALKRFLEKEWPPIEEKLQFVIEQKMRENLDLDDFKVFLIDAFYGKEEGKGQSSVAEINMVDNSLFLICACEPQESCSLFRIIIHEIVHRPLNRIMGQLHDEMKLNTDEITIVSETFARLVEKEVCEELGIPSMTEEEVRKNTEKLGFLDFYLQTAPAWQNYVKNTTPASLKEFVKSQIEQNRETLEKCKYLAHVF